MKDIVKNFFLFGIFFIIIYLNMAFVPSILNDKQDNWNSFKNLFGWGYKKVIYIFLKLFIV